MGDSDRTTEYVRGLLQDAREELSRADSKAALLLAAVGVVIGALLSGMLSGRWTPLQIVGAVQWIWWIGVVVAAAGIGSIATAVYPRIRRHGSARPSVPTYYGDVTEYKNIDDFGTAIKNAPNLDLNERLIDQAFQISWLVQRKYILLRRGLLLLLVASAACIVAIIISIPLK